MLSLTLLICCLCVASSLGRQVPCTGSASYDPDTQLCCNGEVVAKERNLACCSDLHGTGQLYNTVEKICCGDKVLDSTGSDLQCCADQPYNHSTSACCYGKLHQRDADAVCCGESYLKSSEYLCCPVRYNRSQDMYMKKEPGLDLKCCGNKPYNPKLKKCSPYKNVIDMTFAECGRDKIYDMTKNKCCAGELHGVPEQDETLRCCYRHYYNVSEQKCCSDGINSYVIPTQTHTQTPGLECCRFSDTEGFIDTAKHICCVTGKKERKSNLTKCCGNGTYEDGKEDCCGGKYVYNTSSQQCCQGGGQHSVANKDTKCCGGRGLEKDEMCCRNQPVKKGEKDQDDCYDRDFDRVPWPVPERRQPSGQESCGKKFFKSSEAVCCGDKVHKFGKDQILKCCGRNPYDTARYDCWSGELQLKKKSLDCNGVRYPNALPSEKCCGSGIRKYNEDNQTCCENAVFNISSNEASCCKGKAYSIYDNPCFVCGGKNPTSQTCCGDKLYKKFYNPTSMTCCGDKLYKGKHKCCGNRKFRPTTEVCCKGGLLLRKKEGKCCGAFPFLKKFARCDRRSKTLNTRNLTTADLLCKDKKGRRNILNALPAACAFPTVLIGSLVAMEQKGDSLNVTLEKVHSLSLSLGGSFQGQVPSQLHLELPWSPNKCRLGRKRKLLVMLQDNGSQVDSRQDLRHKAHYVMVHSRKAERVLRRSLNARWCREACKRLNKANRKLLSIDKCYRSMRAV